MSTRQYTLGMIGLGVMGSNLALNLRDHGISVIGYDTDGDKVARMKADAGSDLVDAVNNVEEFLHALASPRMIMLLVPAGPPVDAVIRTLLPHLAVGDILIDGGNSHFTDTDIRQQALEQRGIHFLGVGISGGEEGARHGPSIMPGGPREAYAHIRPIYELIAARADGEPCVTYLGSGSAGHYVKMVHNGIEYALMELIAETYDLLKQGYGFSDDELHAIYQQWNQTELQSFLLEITSHIFCQVDPVSGRRLIDVILDVARQKGTGQWASQDAMQQHVPVPLIDTAVAMRDLSTFEQERQAASALLLGPTGCYHEERHAAIPQIAGALFVGMVTAFAQGFAQLRAASAAYRYDLHLGEVARIWQGGCIIRAALLQRIYQIFQRQPDLPHLMLNSDLAQDLSARQADLRNVVWTALDLGIPVPGFMSVLSYYDALRRAWLPANLIQAQRDYFGAHSYERIDEKGFFHTEWA